MTQTRRTFVQRAAAAIAAALMVEPSKLKELPAAASMADKPEPATPPAPSVAKRKQLDVPQLYLVDRNGQRLASISAPDRAVNGSIVLVSSVVERAGEVGGIADENALLWTIDPSISKHVQIGDQFRTTLTLL